MSTPNHQNREDNQAPLLGHPNLPANYASDLLPPHDGPLDDTMIPQPGMGGNISKIPWLVSWLSTSQVITAFKDTLAPAALVGLAFTTCGVFLSGWVGGLVDRTKRLVFVRSVIGVQKTLQIVNCILWLVLLGPLGKDASPAFHFNVPWPTIFTVYGVFLASLINACVLHVGNIGMDVSVERDWVTAIAQRESILLTKLNGWMRMIDLTTKLLAPLFVSVLTANFGYPITGLIIAGENALALFIEFWWIKVVYNRFPILKVDEDRRWERREFLERGEDEDQASSASEGIGSGWAVFVAMPIFYASLAQALTWLDTLAMDGIAVSFFKAGRGWDDGFLAAIRGLCVFTSTIGTVIMPLLERFTGTMATGAWGIWSEVTFIVVPVVTLFIIKVPNGEHGPVLGSVLFFGSVALSRAAHVIFDLAQIKQLQQTLEPHPHRNRLTGLQSSMINVYALLKYGMIFVLSSPEHFKWTALITLVSITAGGMSYMVFVGKSKRQGISL